MGQSKMHKMLLIFILLVVLAGSGLLPDSISHLIVLSDHVSATPTQQVYSNEVPQGLTAPEWGNIQRSIERDQYRVRRLETEPMESKVIYEAPNFAGYVFIFL